MAIQVLNQPVSALQGAGLGLTGGLRELAQQKLAQVQSRNEQNEFIKAAVNYGYSPEQAVLAAQNIAAKRFEGLGQFAEGPRRSSGIESLQSQAAPIQERAVQQEQAAQQQVQAGPRKTAFDLGQELSAQQAGLSSAGLPGQINPIDMIKQMKEMTGQKPNKEQTEKIREIVRDLNENPESRAKMEQQYANAVKNNENIELRRPGFQGPARPWDQVAQQTGQVGVGNPLTQAQRLSEARAERKEKVAEEKEAAKETKQFYLETTKQAEAAEKSEKRLERMEELIDKGSLPFSTFYNLQKNLSESQAFKSVPILGGIIDSLTHAVGFGLREVQRNVTSRDIEEFEKLSNQFIDQAKAMFGSRVTDADLKAYMATVPTLSNTDAGKKQIIASMHAANEASKIKNKAMRSIIRENGNSRPIDLEILVEDRTKDQLDNLAREFVKKPSLSLIQPFNNTNQPQRGSIWNQNLNI